MKTNNDPIKPVHVKRFEKIARDMDNLLNEITKYCPGVNLYLANESWNLLTGLSHEGNGRGRDERPRQERIVTSVLVMRSGGGDW